MLHAADRDRVGHGRHVRSEESQGLDQEEHKDCLDRIANEPYLEMHGHCRGRQNLQGQGLHSCNRQHFHVTRFTGK